MRGAQPPDAAPRSRSEPESPVQVGPTWNAADGHPTVPLDLIIVTPEGEASVRDVEQVRIPAADGEIGVLEDHEKLVSAVVKGVMVVVHPDGRVERLAIGDGFTRVSADRVVVLADHADPLKRSAD